ncbi:hypothetical protein TNCV_19411 [Trichonephila clavipes]|nr:hypothetical protein TNCV_19411 [Trichonephila clavipes]
MLNHPSLWEALPEQDLTFDDDVLVDTDIAVWGALSDTEIVALDHNNTEIDEFESEELTPTSLNLSDEDLSENVVELPPIPYSESQSEQPQGIRVFTSTPRAKKKEKKG